MKAAFDRITLHDLAVAFIVFGMAIGSYIK
jgi:hypothetical protein